MMRKTVIRCSIAALALTSAVLISFPSFPSTFAIIANPPLVNHALKGDRLATASVNALRSHPTLMGAGNHVPVGCDRASGSPRP